VEDAKRHGVRIRRPDINASRAESTLEACPESTGGLALRVGLGMVRSLGRQTAERIVAERGGGGPYRDLAALARRAGLSSTQLELLSVAGAFDSFGHNRREAGWLSGLVAGGNPEQLPDTTVLGPVPRLEAPDELEAMLGDLLTTGLAPGRHPISFARPYLDRIGAVPISRLATVENRRRVRVGGLVTHWQRPATAGGITFLSLEDETGLVNVICSAGLWLRFRPVVRGADALLIRGIVERGSNVTNLIADWFTRLSTGQEDSGAPKTVFDDP
jgi:error-prone DNA polymerase